MDNLSELWMDCNELSQVPTEIGNLSNLTYLDLSRNFLETIPSQVGFLDRLTDLLLAENTLTSLPDSIGKFGNEIYALEQPMERIMNQILYC